jgi:GT2 family glycosyltransferase
MTSVTTVVITRNRWGDLRASLPRHRGAVVVVDNGSSDGSADLVRRHFPHVTVVPLQVNAGAVARNIGALRAPTPYVAFADDDSWWEPNALERAARHLDGAPRLALLAGRVLVEPGGWLDPVSAAHERAPLGRAEDLPGPSVLGFLACGVVVRRGPFLEVGGYDEVVHMYGEETRLAWDLRSAGYGLAYVPDLVAHHQPSTTPRAPGAACLLERNRVLTTLMRRPWPVVTREVLRSLGTSAGRAGLRGAVPRSRAALSRRRLLAPEAEAEARLLEGGPSGTDPSCARVTAGRAGTGPVPPRSPGKEHHGGS